VQPRSTVLICGGQALQNKDGIDTDKKIKDEAVATLLAGDLWKNEKPKKEKKKWEKISKQQIELCVRGWTFKLNLYMTNWLIDMTKKNKNVQINSKTKFIHMIYTS